MQGPEGGCNPARDRSPSIVLCTAASTWLLHSDHGPYLALPAQAHTFLRPVQARSSQLTINLHQHRTLLCTVQEDAGEEGAKGAGFQQQKAADQKAGAGNRAAWNTLFMRPDTVAEAVAAHYGISKSQLLDKEAAGACFSSAVPPSYAARPLHEGFPQEKGKGIQTRLEVTVLACTGIPFRANSVLDSASSMILWVKDLLN